jgi:hypothetical protein
MATYHGLGITGGWIPDYDRYLTEYLIDDKE